MLWGFLNDLSVMMDLSLISINIPGLASIIQGILLNMIYMDLLYTGSWLTPYLEARDIDDSGEQQTDISLNEYFGQSGFSSMTSIKNLGSSFVYILAFSGIMLLYLLVLFLSLYSKV